MKDGQPIDEKNARYKFSQEGKRKYIFELPAALITDVGQYAVVVSGKKGETKAAFALNVYTQDDL